MCLPLLAVAAVAAVVISAASASMAIVSQRAQQKAQIGYQTRLQDANAQQMQENRDLATKAYLDQASAANKALAETREATAASNFDEARKAAEAKGATLASASEAGVYGVSLENLLSDFNRQEAMFKQRNEQNLLFKQQSTATAIRGYQAEAAARTGQIRPYIAPSVAPVDYIGPALQVAQSGASSYMNYSAGASRGAGTRPDMNFNPYTAGR